ncbi:hypothetical protein BgiBS90_030787 [Biomphalaria glabrata]|nr:hypothetical protein BgiBS90_030787 [Biomphalaria glabrata]
MSGSSKLLPTDQIESFDLTMRPMKCMSLVSRKRWDPAEVDLFSDSLDSSKTTCPAELLGHYRELSCNTTVDVCSDRKQMIFDTKDCNLETFYFAGNVTLLCLTSLSLGETTYVTVYRDDDNAEGYWNSSFLCMAVIINDTTVYIRHTPRDCHGLDTPAQDAADLVLETLDLCPIECSFSTSLFGSWVSNRKGDLLITNDTLTGFEPYGAGCNATECSYLPTEFKCFLKSGTKYLIRSLRTTLSSNTVRIYVCIDFTKISKYKVIYYQAHPTKDPFLQDYLTYLNAAQSVDSIQDVCEFNASYDAALHSVLLSKEKMLEASAKCPEVLHFINRVDSVTCPYQMTSCDHETFIQITEDNCGTKPMYSESGQLSCIYDVASGSDHYLTLLNMDKAVDNNYTFLFTCIAYRLVNEKTWFLSDSPMACHPGQMTDETQSLYNVSIIALAAEQTWIIALAVVIVAIVLATVLFLIVWFLCGGRDRCPGHRDKPSLTLTEAEKQFYGQKWSSAGSSRGGEGHYNISFEDVFSTQKDGRTQGQCYEGQRQRRSLGKSRRGFFGNDGEADTSELTEDTEGITHDGRSTAETQALEYEQFTQDLNELKCSGESNGLQRESTLISLPQDKTVGVLSDDGFHEDVDGEVDTSTEKMDEDKIHATRQEHAQNHRKSRTKGDDQDMVNSETSEIDMSISQDATRSAAKPRNVLGVSKNAGYIRKHRKYPGRTLLTSLSGQTLRHHAHGHNKTLVTGHHGLELQDTPFYSEYHDYTTLRSQMVRDGFWDDQNDYFSSLNRLNERDHSLSNIADIGVVQTSAKEQTSGADVTSCQTENKTNVASSKRITSKRIQALTGINSEDNNLQLDEKQTENLQQFASEGKYEQVQATL